MNPGLRIGVVSVALAATAIVLGSFERPSPDSVQHGYRGTGMVQVYNPRILEATVAANQVPAGLPRGPSAGPRASQVYQNVQVLGDLTVGEFTRLMVGITQWVSPAQGCGYCHAGNNFADESLYTKQVSRRMLQMTQHINQNWKDHVEETGVTCYTCHRGQPVPANAWAENTGGLHAGGMAADKQGQNLAARSVGYTSLPYDPFTAFLGQDNSIRVAGTQALPAGNRNSIKSAEWTYGLMMHFSTALGVNCTFCHNSRNFSDWDQSSPTRLTAWHGIRMIRDLNANYITPLQPLWAANPGGPAGGGPAVARLGPHGDALKVNCTTCHQGAYQPLLGAKLAQEYPELLRVSGSASR
jgi:photosynthetic reaction center cytochrome c subunit